MKNYILDKKYLKLENSGTKGVQEKYNRGGYWYKVNTIAREGLVEHLVSLVLRNSTLSKESYVYYEMCTINGKNGCRSKTFLRQGEEFISFSRLSDNLQITGQSLSLQSSLNMLGSSQERLSLLLSVGMKAGLDLTKYFKALAFLDMLILNRDRHAKNYGVIYNGELNRFRVAPIFDNGLSLNTGLSPYESVHSKMFSGSFEDQIVQFGYPIESPFYINYTQLYSQLNNYRGVEVNILKKQLAAYEDIFRK